MSILSLRVSGRWRYAAGIVLALVTIVAAGLFFRNGEAPTSAQIELGTGTPVPTPGRWQSAEVADIKRDGVLGYVELMVRGLPTEGCEHRASISREEASPEEKEEMLNSLAVSSASLSATDDPGFLLAAALLNWDAEDRRQIFERALAANTQDPVALWYQLQNCDEFGCDRSAVEEAVTTIDESNGMAWLEIGSARIREGKWDEAEAALRRAAMSPRFDTYFIDTAMVVERGLAATTDLDYSDRIVWGIGIAAAVAIPAFGDVSSACQSDENDPLNWVDLCDDLGEQMSDVSRELITSMIGYGYRKAAASRSGDKAAFELLDNQRRRIYHGMMSDQAASGAQVLLQNDPSVMQDYVENFLAHGELTAMEMLIKDARRLRSDPDYDQCNFVGNPDYSL